MQDSLSPLVAERLGYYVYMYIDPRNDQVFYVGKGLADRALAHLTDASASRKSARISDIRASGRSPRIDILVHGLATEDMALRIEAAVIDALGVTQLTNEVRGWETGKVGRMPLSELESLYGAVPVVVEHPSLLIRIDCLYRYGMGADHLYEITRGVWKVGAKRRDARYALAVFHGVVREVFAIDARHPAGSTPYSFRAHDDLARPGRWEFTGRVAEEFVRSRYMGRSVREAHFAKGLRSPVIYASC